MDYDLAEVLRGQLQGQGAPAETVRDIEAVTGEIIHLKQELARNIVEIGLRLIEAKEMLSHGEWLPWLEERVYFSEKSAQNYMRVAREFPNPQLVADLGVRKALALLELPPAERESFVEENGVIDMTSRELEKAIRERDEARKAAEAAQADARSAEESRAKMEADMRALKEIHVSAVKEADEAVAALLAARKELEELRTRPVDVAVEVDQEAVEKARAEAVAAMKVKVDQAVAARKEAEAHLNTVRKSLKETSDRLTAVCAEAHACDALKTRAEKAEAELAEARRQLEAAAKAEKASIVNQNGDLALFNVIFNQTQESVNKMHGLRLKLGKADKALDEKLKTAINALADAVRRCAE